MQKIQALLLVAVLIGLAQSAVVAPHYQQGVNKDIVWNANCQHVLHCDSNPGRTVDVKIEFGEAFDNVPKVLLTTELYDYGNQLPNGYFMEVHDITEQGFVARLTATTAKPFFTNFFHYFATDDPRVHVQYFDTTEVGSMGKGNGARGEMYTIPILGWVPYGEIAYASFEQGQESVRGHTQIRQDIKQITKNNEIKLRAGVWWQTNLSRFRVGILLMCGGAGWGSENVVGDWGGGHFMVNGNGDRKVPGSAKLPVAFQNDETKYIFGISGYLAWVTYQRAANGRFAIQDVDFKQGEVTFNFRTWANSQQRIIEVQFAMINPGGMRYSNQGCIVLFNQCYYQGEYLELCEASNDLEDDGFEGAVKSIWMPPGRGVKLYSQENLEGTSAVFESPQSCIAGNIEFSFAQVQ